MPQTIRKICFNRNNLRLWIEGKFLTECGFAHGDRFDLTELHSGNFLIEKKPTGARKIAGSQMRPIIDINSTKTLASLGKAGDKIILNSNDAGLISIQNKGE